MERPDKFEVRARVRAAVHSLSAAERQTESSLLCETMLNQPVWAMAKVVLLYAPLSDEPDIAPLFDSGWKEAKALAVPRFDTVAGEYLVAQIDAPSQLVRGQFGVLEAAPGCPAVSLNQLDLILVPGVAFDLTGRRLGRGKGFYDRLLAKVRGHKCGVAFDRQLVAELPEEPHDVRVNSILTPTRWLSARVD